MSIRYLNSKGKDYDMDNVFHTHLIPGEFLVFPSAIRLSTPLDHNKEIFTQLLEAPLLRATFTHEYQHFLSLLGTTYGNSEIILQLGIMDTMFEQDGPIHVLKQLGTSIFDLSQSIDQYLLENYDQLSKSTLISLNQLLTANIYVDTFSGIKINKNDIDIFLKVFSNVTPPEDEEYTPSSIRVIAPHTGQASNDFLVGTWLIHEGAARESEFRTLSEPFDNDKKNISKGSFIIREEQFQYQVTRSFISRLFDLLSIRDTNNSSRLWHSLVCDLSLMGPPMVALAVGRKVFKWHDVYPGWRFQKAALALKKIPSNELIWDSVSRDEYIQKANSICRILDWPIYEELLEIGQRQTEVDFPTVEGSFINEYYKNLFRRVWDCKKKFPHLFFNLNWGKNQEIKDFLEKMGLPPVMIFKKYIQFHPKGDEESFQDNIFKMLHIYCTISQLLYRRQSEPFQCYNSFFRFDCKKSNGSCGQFPNTSTPSDCPFVEWLNLVGIKT